MNRKKIKLCFFSPMAYPLFKKTNGNHGGAEVDLYLISTEIAKNDRYSVSLLVGDYGQEPLELIENVRLIKLKYESMKTEKSLIRKILKRLYLVTVLVKYRFDLYFLEAMSEHLGYIVFIGKMLGNGKVIYRTASDLDYEYLEYLHGFERSLFGFAIQHTDILISQHVGQKERWENKLKMRSIVVENGFRITSSNIACKEYFLWVGRADKLKRPDLFLDIAMKLPGKKFVMIIPGENPLSERIRTRAIGMDNVIYSSGISFFDIQDYYNGAKCLINTSQFEGFPNTFIQAFLGKTPVLSFLVNPGNIIDDFNLGLCCRDDIDQAIDFINNLDDQVIMKLGENAFRYVNERHDIRQKVSLYTEMIDTLVGEK
ncbi:MAG: glycosyltransferase [Candidatus Omnitrophica bacterium]|nr:glycosyltransferase [Candidatus Omnitrophota bacterium]